MWFNKNVAKMGVPWVKWNKINTIFTQLHYYSTRQIITTYPRCNNEPNSSRTQWTTPNCNFCNPTNQKLCEPLINVMMRAWRECCVVLFISLWRNTDQQSDAALVLFDTAGVLQVYAQRQPASLVQISKMAKTNGCDHQLRLFSVKPNHAGSGLIYQSHDVQSQAPLANTFIFVTAGFPLYKGNKWNVTIKMCCIWLVNELRVGAFVSYHQTHWRVGLKALI